MCKLWRNVHWTSKQTALIQYYPLYQVPDERDEALTTHSNGYFSKVSSINASSWVECIFGGMYILLTKTRIYWWIKSASGTELSGRHLW